MNSNLLPGGQEAKRVKAHNLLKDSLPAAPWPGFHGLGIKTLLHEQMEVVSAPDYSLSLTVTIMGPAASSPGGLPNVDRNV